MKNNKKKKSSFGSNVVLLFNKKQALKAPFIFSMNLDFLKSFSLVITSTKEEELKYLKKTSLLMILMMNRLTVKFQQLFHVARNFRNS